jgi:hypothetical protein
MGREQSVHNPPTPVWRCAVHPVAWSLVITHASRTAQHTVTGNIAAKAVIWCFFRQLSASYLLLLLPLLL